MMRLPHENKYTVISRNKRSVNIKRLLADLALDFVNQAFYFCYSRCKNSVRDRLKESII